MNAIWLIQVVFRNKQKSPVFHYLMKSKFNSKLPELTENWLQTTITDWPTKSKETPTKWLDFVAQVNRFNMAQKAENSFHSTFLYYRYIVIEIEGYRLHRHLPNLFSRVIFGFARNLTKGNFYRWKGEGLQWFCMKVFSRFIRR